MKAMIRDSYGPPDVLELRAIDKPVVDDHGVLIRVHAAGLDPGVWHLLTGLPYLVRLSCGLRKPKSHVLGWDLAGRVEAVGKNVTRFRPGDEVFGACNGSFAEYACAREDRLVLKPGNLGFEQAAVIPTSATTALQALRDKAGLQAGQEVLIIGAGGGVGTYAIQIAKAFGATVTGVCSPGKADLVGSVGADRVMDYSQVGSTEGGQKYDVILDTVGRLPLSRLRGVLARQGTLVLIGGEGGGPWLGGVNRMLGALVVSPMVSQGLRPMLAQLRVTDLEYLKRLIEEGKLSPVIDRRYPLAELAEAVRYLAAGSSRGKVVLDV